MIRKVKLKQVCREITVGHVGPMADQYVESGVPFLRSQNILPFRLDESNLKFIGSEFHRRLKKSALSPGDVLVVRTGYPGTACELPRHFPVANCADLVIIRPSAEVDGYFLCCLFNSTWGKGRVAGSLVGVAQQHFNIGVVKEMEVSLPPIRVQKQITSILSAFDRLIENNTRRINILEEVSQMIYREWFVNFRFPGHEKARITESEFGTSPSGWTIASFSDLSDILSGGTPRTSVEEFWNGGIPFFGPTDAPKEFFVIQTEKNITPLGLSRCNSKLYPAETVFITARGTVGKVSMPAVAMAMNQSCYALRGKTGINQLFLFMLARHCSEQLQKKAHGAVFDTITVETFQKLNVLRPPDSIIGQFEPLVRPCFSLMLNLQRANSNLRTTRDFLLPRLISGAIRVEQLEAETASPFS